MPYEAETLVVGCGNLLFKDDGFGPAVINALEEHFKDKEMPEDTMFIDAGTGATHFIFTLPDESWKKVIVVDVVEFDAEPGTLKIFSPFDMPRGTYENVHTWPVEEPLHDLAKTVEVVIVGCKPKEISAPDVDMGLTDSVEKAIPEAINMILKEIGV
ncbi:hydrogenase 1 maturation protease [Methanobrevibacter cuticularis]|uniref:Hydrogenase 1 maturation protease n=1 Tax=Methanobrevibacter cuticularis TaxID=47311 RepID=A0A166DCH6_9EURY|nr:coenzyme F420-reducing hydrogenase, FrhD protein [Methanobrevibacter cuticularis]KZX15443.1 hydrogenase 1 maturation protease [Methanobrevibacter cuticularis]